MVKGFDTFKEWFRGYERQYTIIGGTACDILMAQEDLDFRATKDIDMVLILEAMTADFGKHFWAYIRKGGYQFRNKSTGVPQFYRFSHPNSAEFPAMIELFSRRVDAIELPEDAILTPLPMEEDISSLSAILLNDDYYAFLCSGQMDVDGVTILEPAHLIPFKAKAWLDLTERKNKGEQVDSRNIRKHRNDVFRLTELIAAGVSIPTPDAISQDMSIFLSQMQAESIDLKQLGIVGRTKEEILQQLHQMFIG